MTLSNKIKWILRFVVPDMPVIPFIEGDGTGPDIWTSAVNVIDEAVKIAYKKKSY